jgi:hypothetical protein
MVTDHSGADKSALQRWKDECKSANERVRHKQANGIMAKKDWLDFSEEIRLATDRLFAQASADGSDLGIGPQA